MPNPIVSIIIPCYNLGEYIREAIESVEQYPDPSLYEIIIVNDGSTSEETLRILNELKEGYQIIDQPNRGPAAARNAGIVASKGQYLLLLDSDNRIRTDYIDRGIELLSKHPDVGVVHGKPFFFGDMSKNMFTARRFDLASIFAQNYIDNCAIIRRSVWEELEGFDEKRILIGNEDWEFWIRVGASKWQFYFIDQIMFDYRLRQGSVISQATQTEKFREMENYVVNKHLQLYIQHYKKLHSQYLFYQNDRKRPLRAFFKYLLK